MIIERKIRKIGKRYYTKHGSMYWNNVAMHKALKRAYGIDLVEWQRIFNKQNGLCAICERSQDEFNRKLNVDHDHSTGKIRGLLCGGCNRRLGLIEDRFWLGKALMYLDGIDETTYYDKLAVKQEIQ